MQDDLAGLFEFSRWADDRVLQVVRRLMPEQYTQEPAPDCPSIRAILVHMADASLIPHLCLIATSRGTRSPCRCGQSCATC